MSGRPYSACIVLTQHCQFVILSQTKKDQGVLLTLKRGSPNGEFFLTPPLPLVPRGGGGYEFACTSKD